MIKLREPFSQKVQLHIKQDLLQRLWDKYVPSSSAEYERIQLVYLSDALGEMEKKPEQIQLLLQLILKNKMMQLNLMQYPALVKVGQKQMERRLRQIERFYAAQLKSCDFTMFRTVRQYFALLDQAGESSRRYQSWLKDYQEVEKQREEYRLLSLFSVKLRELLTERSVDTLRTMEREFVDSLSKTEYHALAEELIWQEKRELLAYLKTCNQTQCEEIFKMLEKDTHTRELLASAAEQPVKERLATVVEQMEQKEFCLFYHQVAEREDVSPQMIVWKESRTQMLHAIDEMEPEILQQVWEQIEEMAQPLGQNILQTQGDVLELLDSLSETEYRVLAKELIWQEKPRVLTYLEKCSTTQCEKIIKMLEKDVQLSEVLSLIAKQPVKEKLIAAVERMEQNAFCSFYHQVEKIEDVNPQVVLWKENKTEMLHRIEHSETEILQQVWSQMETAARLLERDKLWVQENSVFEQNMLQAMEKELVYSLLETEYQTFAEALIWKEKPEFVAYLKECSKARCKEIIIALEKDIQITEVLESVQKQSVRKKLVAAARKLKQPEFSRLYWQVVELKGVNPPIIIWKKNRIEMLHSFDGMNTERLQEAWAQMEAVAPVKGMKHIYSEKMQHLQKQYQQKDIQNVQEQITAILKENGLEKITDIVNVEQLMQDLDTADYTERELTENTKEIELLFDKSSRLTMRDEIYQVIQRLEHERQIRREQIEQQQAWAVEIYQETYAQILETESGLLQQQEYVERFVEQTFLERHQETFTQEEIQNIREWSRAFLEVCFMERENVDSPDLIQGDNQDNNQKENQNNRQASEPELVHIVEQMNHYMEEQHGFRERLILNLRKDISKDERIQNVLRSVRNMEKEQIQKLTQYLADMIVIRQEVSVSEQVYLNEKLNAAPLPNRAETTKRPVQELAMQKLLQDNDIPMPDISYRNLWEWGETLLFHPEHQQEQEDADIISISQQNVVSADGVQQEDIQTQVIRHQIAMAKDRNHLQRLIRQINHQADTQLVYADAQLKLPQVQALLQYIRQLDEKQYGVLVKELAQITKIQKMPYENQETTEESRTEVHTEEIKNPVKTRTLPYPVLVQRIQNYEKQHRVELYREIGRIEQKIFPKIHEKVNEVTSYEESENEYGRISHARIETEYALVTAYEKTRQENKYQPQKLEYSAQKALSSEEDQQRNELRMQQETAQIRSVQEQLGKKLKEVENQLKKVEDSTKAKEDAGVFAEQVKRQLYEELHVEKLRRGLV